MPRPIRSYRQVLNAADFVFADGTGVRWAARLQGVRILENMVGTDFVPTLFQATAGRGYSYFMLGADAQTIAAAADYARRTFPGWTQAGYHHGYLTDEALVSAAIDQINAARPDVLLVGMGNPLQERWIHQHLPRLNVGVCLGIGGLFDYWAGNVSRAPAWLRRLGHEWLWRLCQQPPSEGPPLPRRQSAVPRPGAARTVGGNRPAAIFRALGQSGRMRPLRAVVADLCILPTPSVCTPAGRSYPCSDATPR